MNTKLPPDDHREQIFLTASYAVAQVADAAIFALPVATQNGIDAAIRAGANLAVLVVLTPAPEFLGLLSAGPDAEPVELFRVAVPREALRPPQGVGH
jgi:hypothetical protein